MSYTKTQNKSLFERLNRSGIKAAHVFKKTKSYSQLMRHKISANTLSIGEWEELSTAVDKIGKELIAISREMRKRSS